MKKILVNYTLEIPENKLEKVCRLAMISKRDMINSLRIKAETYGRVAVFVEIENILQRR